MLAQGYEAARDERGAAVSHKYSVNRQGGPPGTSLNINLRSSDLGYQLVFYVKKGSKALFDPHFALFRIFYR